MQQGEKRNSAYEQQLSKACQYVNDMWFPINPVQLKKIQDGLSQGNYNSEMTLLIDDLKSDPALFLYCVRELLKQLRAGGVVSAPTTQTELFVGAGLELLQQILQVKGDTISAHSLLSCTKLQEARLGEMFISASATEALCEAAQVDADLGFAVALFRQLGLALIAWNYPRVYRDAALGAALSGSLDLALTRRLGFSPGALGLRVCRAWGMAPQLLEAIVDDGSEAGKSVPEERIIGESLSATIATLCRVGEALARANNPEQYPTARSDWNNARDAIEDRLGFDGIRFIRERVAQYTTAFIETAPEIFQAGVALDPELRLQLRGRRAAGEIPASYRNCSPSLRASLHRLYRAIDAKHPTDQVLVQWKTEIASGAGFIGGYLFSLEPTLRLLMPQLAFGEASLKDATQVHCAERESLVSEAFRAAAPLVREQANGRFVIAGIFGFSSRVGVVYVEVARQEYLASPEGQLAHFWALTNSLSDALSLS